MCCYQVMFRDIIKGYILSTDSAIFYRNSRCYPNNRIFTGKIAMTTGKNSHIEENQLPYQNLSELTIQRYSWILSDFENWCNENKINYANPKSRNIVDYLKGKEGWGTSRKTVAIAALKRWFDYCELKDNPARSENLRKTGRAGKAFASKRLPVALTDSESAAFLQKTSPDQKDSFPVARKKMIQRLLFWTGLRVSEAISIKIGDIHIDEEHPFLQVIGKGDKERQLPIVDQLLWELEVYLEKRESYLIRFGCKKDILHSGPLFCDRFGNQPTAGGVWSMVKSTIESIGLHKRHMGPHVLRIATCEYFFLSTST